MGAFLISCVVFMVIASIFVQNRRKFKEEMVMKMDR